MPLHIYFFFFYSTVGTGQQNNQPITRGDVPGTLVYPSVQTGGQTVGQQTGNVLQSGISGLLPFLQ